MNSHASLRMTRHTRLAESRGNASNFENDQGTGGTGTRGKPLGVLPADAAAGSSPSGRAEEDP